MLFGLPRETRDEIHQSLTENITLMADHNIQYQHYIVLRFLLG